MFTAVSGRACSVSESRDDIKGATKKKWNKNGRQRWGMQRQRV